MAKNGTTEMATAVEETALDTVNQNELAEYFGSTIPRQEGVEFRFAQCKIAHQNKAWELPDGDVVKKIKGVIIHIQNVNAWWEQSFNETGGGVPPDCSSLNGIRPEPSSNKLQAETCRECPRNVFGSDGKRGKSCKNMKRVYLLMEGYQLPVRVTVPPTSIRSINEYGSLLANKGLQYIMVTSQLNLKEAQNKDSIKYSEISPQLLGPSATSKAEADKLINLKKELYGLMTGDAINANEYDSAA